MFDTINRREFFFKFFKGLFYFISGIMVFKRQIIFRAKLFIKNCFFSLLVPSKGKGVLFSEEGDKILFRMNKNQEYEMNETAAFIWKNCNGRKSLRKISKEVSEEFSVSEADAFRDTSYFIRKLKKCGYLQYV